MNERISASKKLLFGCAAVGIGLAVFLLFAEAVLRFLPVNEGLRLMPVNRENPVFRFTPNRTAVWSEGWNFNIVNKVRVNNDGFVNGQDYDPSSRRPLLAVIGDSYVEAGIVPYEETVQGRLAKAAGEGRVYSFAASGAGLSQYLVWARYARDTYKPGAFVFVIIGNDFSEALFHREHSPGFHHFERLQDGKAVLRRVDYNPGLLRRIGRQSALFMYLMTNVKAQRLIHLDIQKILGKEDKRWVANIEAQAPEDVVKEYCWAFDRFLELLPAYTGVDPSRIALVMDGFRPQMYRPGAMEEVRESVWAKMRNYVQREATLQKMVVIDMHEVFMERFGREGKRFEFPTDSHWNGEGHRAAADAISRTELYQNLFPEN